jgi:hypothetical protein
MRRESWLRKAEAALAIVAIVVIVVAFLLRACWTCGEHAMTEQLIWSLVKNGHGARAIARGVPGFGLELRYLWDGELRQSKVFP